MKSLFIAVILIGSAWINPVFSQNSQTQSLLTSYYSIKDALLISDAATAALKAGELSKILGNLDTELLSESERTAFKGFQEKLAADAKFISTASDLSAQRAQLASLSIHFFKLAKAVKLTREPIYYDYCPMKKSYWLSDHQAIKNPYFGKQMLTCGAIKETLK